MRDLLWKCCKNIVDVTTFFFYFFTDFVAFFFPIFGNAIAIIAKNLYHLFWQWHCHNCQKKIFPHHLVFLARTHILSTHPGSRMGRRNYGNTIAENKKFLSLAFYLSLSNFCWILAMVLPQFTLFPQIAK